MTQMCEIYDDVVLVNHTTPMRKCHLGPDQSGTGSGPGGVTTAAGLDKDRSVAYHEHYRVEYGMQLPECELLSILHIVTSTSEIFEISTESVPLSNLKAVTLPELSLDKRHYGRVLYGRFCVKPFKIMAVNTVLEDGIGRGVAVSMYNVLSFTASNQEIEARFPLGMHVAIKEPYFKLCCDGRTVVRVDDPADIICLANNSEDLIGPPPDSTDDNKEDSVTPPTLDTLRCEGNRLFLGHNWIGAVDKYSQCISLAVSHIEEQVTKKKDWENNLQLAYSNRAEARLQLEAYEEALSDAEKALDLDPTHVETLLRKGRAAKGLGLFEISCKAFKAALNQSPGQQSESILKSFRASTTALEQSQDGKFKFESSEYRFLPWKVDTLGDSSSSCADFAGPVEIRRVSYGYGRRGLFATRDVEARKLLLVSNPLAIAWQPNLDETQCKAYINLKDTFKDGAKVSVGHQEDLVAEVINRVTTSKRRLAQFQFLASEAEQEMQMPSMELFRSGSSRWLAPEGDKLLIDIGHIREVVKLNSFGIKDLCPKTRLNGPQTWIVDRGDDHDLGARGEQAPGIGIWALPSFANHSCSPNCLVLYIGQAMFFRTARDIKEGEEVTISYFGSGSDLYRTVDARRALVTSWFLTCQCERCLLEESLKPQLSDISSELSIIMAGGQQTIDEAFLSIVIQGRDPTMEDAAALVSKVEGVINSHDSKLERKHRGWIRASFLEAYKAKYELAMKNRDTESVNFAVTCLEDSLTSVCRDPRAEQWVATFCPSIFPEVLEGDKRFALPS